MNTAERMLQAFYDIRTAALTSDVDKLAAVHRECLADFIVTDRAAQAERRGNPGGDAMTWVALLAMIEHPAEHDYAMNDLTNLCAANPALGVATWRTQGFSKADSELLYLTGGPYLV